MEQEIAHLLKHGKLRATSTRRRVLEKFILAGNQALSSYELENTFKEEVASQGAEKIDRITLYRTLKTFEEVGIIHQAVDISGKSKYALCSADCSMHSHDDHHAHFFCKKCEKTVCLDEVKIPKVNLPQNFQLEDSQLVLSGICNKCQL
ncbi:MAG: transcriptional repressor [Bacteroidota bacterium]